MWLRSASAAALVDVLVQEVQAAGEAEGLDLFEEVLDGDGGIFGPALAQVLAVGVDEAGTVFGDAEHSLGTVGRLTVFRASCSRRAHSSRPTPFASRLWTWCQRSRVVCARGPS